MDVQAIISSVFQILYVVTILGLTAVIISENRNPQKTISWVLVLTFLPIVGLVLYIVFGQNHRKVRRLTKRMNKGLKGKSEPNYDFLHTLDSEDEYSKLKRLLFNVDEAPVLTGNQVDFFSSGKEKFEHLFEDIRNARQHIHILYYKIGDDKIGNELKQLLIRKAKEGVEVRLVYDDVGSINTKSRFFREMKKQGVMVACFLPIKFPHFARRVNYRNHRKIVVIDGEIGYTGGINVEDCYIWGLKWGVWQDMSVRIRGRGVHALQLVFFKDWYYAYKESIQSSNYFPALASFGNNPLQVVSSSPVETYENLAEGFFRAITTAQHSIYIQTPYFIPSEELIKALQNASLSGIKVSIMIPKKSDNYFVGAATLSSVRTLLEHNINVYLYTAGFLHSKMIVVDENLVVVGSANMDVRSLELNFETSVFIYDEESAKKGKLIFEHDQQYAECVSLDSWKRRPRLRQYFESVLRLLTPLL